MNSVTLDWMELAVILQHLRIVQWWDGLWSA
jgi:hypothetical protein